MKSFFIQLIALLTISLGSYGQDIAQLKRTPYKLRVAVDRNSVYELGIKGTEYVSPDKTIQLYAGETVYIEVEQENGDIKSMTAVKEIINPAKTITISFTQSIKENEHESMMLKVINPFEKNLVYKAKIFLFQEKKWVNTDVFPIQPRLSGLETWPDIIPSIGLGDWSFKRVTY